MFCENCGSQNVDGAKFCASCGAPLAASQPVQPVEQPRYQEPQPRFDYNYSYQQPQPVQPAPQGKSAGAIVVYMISGALALLSILMVFLPHVTAMYQSFNPFQLIGAEALWSRSSEAAVGGVIIVALLVLPMILQLVWAILSFVRVKAAGVLGLIASIFAVNHSLVWLIILAAIRESTGRFASVTAVPVVMIILAIAGLVLSIIQMTKKNRVR